MAGLPSPVHGTSRCQHWRRLHHGPAQHRRRRAVLKPVTRLLWCVYAPIRTQALCTHLPYTCANTRHRYTQMCASTPVHTHAQMHTHLHTLHTRMCTQSIHTHRRVHPHLCTHLCTGTYAQAYTPTHIFHTHVQRQGTDTHKRVHPLLCTHTDAQAHTSAHTSTHTCTQTCVHPHLCTYSCAHTSTDAPKAHMHTHMCRWTQRNLDLHSSKLKRCTMRTFRQLDPSVVREPKPEGPGTPVRLDTGWT